MWNPARRNSTEVNPKDTDQYYPNLDQIVLSCPASLVFNMDEAGQDEYIDTHFMRVIFPYDYINCTINIQVRRKSIRPTLFHCICADGTYLKPLIIIPSKTLDNILLKMLYCNNYMTKLQEKGNNNTEIMKIWLTKIILPVIKEKWESKHRRTKLNACTCCSTKINRFC